MGNYIAFKNYTKNFKLFHKFQKKPIFINCKNLCHLRNDTLLFLMRFVLISAEFCENTFY